MTSAVLSSEDQEYLRKCEEQFKDRYTEKDAEFMKVHDADPPTPPIMETWWVPQNSGRRNNRRFNRPSHPYERPERRSDYDNDGGHGYRNRNRY